MIPNWLKGVAPRITNTKCAVFFGTLHIVLFLVSYGFFSSTKLYKKWWVHIEPILEYRFINVACGFAAWILLMFCGLGCYVVLNLPKIKKVGIYIVRYLLCLGLPLGSVYLGLKFENIPDLCSIVLLAASMVCLLTAFCQPEDFGFIDSLVAAALALVINIHGNEKKREYKIAWHIQGVLVIFISGGRLVLPDLMRFLIKLGRKARGLDHPSNQSIQVRGRRVVEEGGTHVEEGGTRLEEGDMRVEEGGSGVIVGPANSYDPPIVPYVHTGHESQVRGGQVVEEGGNGVIVGPDDSYDLPTVPYVHVGRDAKFQLLGAWTPDLIDQWSVPYKHVCEQAPGEVQHVDDINGGDLQGLQPDDRVRDGGDLQPDDGGLQLQQPDTSLSKSEWQEITGKRKKKKRSSRSNDSALLNTSNIKLHNR